MKKLIKLSTLSKSASCAVLAMALFPTAGHAQVDEIIVTAQKRSESLDTVPVAVTAYDAEALETLGVNTADDLVNLTPGLTSASLAGSNKNYFLRGIGTGDFHLTAASSVGQYFDGVTLTSGFLARAALFDMERVEVLKGPQNTLFGLNTTGGAVNYISQKPDVGGGLNGYGTVKYGSDNHVNLEGAIGFDIGETAAARISLTHNSHDGPFESLADGTGFGDDNLDAYRVAFAWEPTEKASFLINLHGSESENNGGVVKAVGTRNPDGSGNLCAEFDPFSPVDFTQATNCVGRNGGAVGQAPTNPSSDKWESTSQRLGLEEISTFGGYVNFDYDFDFATLNLVAAYDNLDFRASNDGSGSQTFGFFSNQADDRDTYQYEARLVSDSANRFRWIAGVYYLDDSADAYTGVQGPAVNFAANRRIPNVQLDYGKENLGIYGQGEFDITDTVTLTSGVRWSDEEIVANYLPSAPLTGALTSTPIFQDTINRLVAGNAGMPGFDANGYEIARQVSRSTSNEDVGYTVKLDWQATEDALLYASYAKGFKGGAADIRAVFALVPPFLLTRDLDSNQLSPESLDAYEIGYKGSFFDNYVTVDLAGFYYQFNDKQQFIVSGGTPTLDNAPESELYGLDVNVKYANDKGFYADLGLSLLDTEITDVGDSTLFVEGTELPNSPKFSMSLVLAQEFELANDRLVTVAGNMSHTGEVIKGTLTSGNILAEALGTQEDYTLFNAFVSYEFGDDARYKASIFGNNLTNEHYCGQLANLSGNGATMNGISPRALDSNVICRTDRGSTRTFGASLGVKF